jgi:hypothetical protein
MSCEMLEKNGRTLCKKALKERPKGVLLREVLLKESRLADRVKPRLLSLLFIPALGCGVMSSKKW